VAEAEVVGADVTAILERAEGAARRERAREVRPEHVLLALAEARPAAVLPHLERHKVSEKALLDALAKRRPPEGGAEGAGLLAPDANGAGPLAPAPETAALLARAKGRALLRRAKRAEPQDLLAALLDDRASAGAEVLGARFGLTAETLAAASGAPAPVPEDAAPALPAGLPGEALPPGLLPAPPGGVGLSAEVRDLDLKLRMLEARVQALRARGNRQSRRLALVFLLLLASQGALLAYLFGLLGPFGR
jgi:hypothetical protein